MEFISLLSTLLSESEWLLGLYKIQDTSYISSFFKTSLISNIMVCNGRRAKTKTRIKLVEIKYLNNFPPPNHAMASHNFSKVGRVQ